jgi:hypothetical protein
MWGAAQMTASGNKNQEAAERKETGRVAHVRPNAVEGSHAGRVTRLKNQSFLGSSGSCVLASDVFLPCLFQSRYFHKCFLI